MTWTACALQTSHRVVVAPLRLPFKSCPFLRRLWYEMETVAAKSKSKSECNISDATKMHLSKREDEARDLSLNRSQWRKWKESDGSIDLFLKMQRTKGDVKKLIDKKDVSDVDFRTKGDPWSPLVWLYRRQFPTETGKRSPMALSVRKTRGDCGGEGVNKREKEAWRCVLE